MVKVPRLALQAEADGGWFVAAKSRMPIQLQGENEQGYDTTTSAQHFGHAVR